MTTPSLHREAARLGIHTRIDPTPEDLAVYQRHLQRIIRECDRAGRSTQETVIIIRNWTVAYVGGPAMTAS